MPCSVLLRPRCRVLRIACEFGTRIGAAVHLVRSVGEAKSANRDPSIGKAKILRHAGAAMRLHGVVKNFQRHRRRSHLHHRSWTIPYTRICHIYSGISHYNAATLEHWRHRLQNIVHTLYSKMRFVQMRRKLEKELKLGANTPQGCWRPAAPSGITVTCLSPLRPTRPPRRNAEFREVRFALSESGSSSSTPRPS